jgi:hypothetical protein
VKSGRGRERGDSERATISRFFVPSFLFLFVIFVEYLKLVVVVICV